MAKLYIANCTKQTQIISFRFNDNTPGSPQRFTPAKQTPPIPRGRQIPVGGDMNLPQIEDIVDQLSKFGLHGEKDIARLPGRIVPYIFNIDQPVKAESIRRVVAHNSGVMLDQGRQRREASAVAANDALNVQAATEGIVANTFEASVEQLEVSDMDEKSIDEGYRVTKNLTEVPDKTRAAKGRKNAA